MQLTSSTGINISEPGGYLEIAYGPMTSGKSTFLVKKATDAAREGHNVLYVNYLEDKRDTVGGDGKKFTCHWESLKVLSDKVKTASTLKLSDVNVDEYDVVAVDEGHFYPDIYETVRNWVENKKKYVYIAALDGDFKRELFGDVYRLNPIADKFEKYQARCNKCLEEIAASGYRHPIISLPAPFTMRIEGGKEVKEIGGNDKYLAVCRIHHSVK